MEFCWRKDMITGRSFLKMQKMRQVRLRRIWISRPPSLGRGRLGTGTTDTTSNDTNVDTLDCIWWKVIQRSTSTSIIYHRSKQQGDRIKTNHCDDPSTRRTKAWVTIDLPSLPQLRPLKILQQQQQQQQRLLPCRPWRRNRNDRVRAVSMAVLPVIPVVSVMWW